MTVFYGTQMTKIDSVAATQKPGFVNGNVSVFAETVTLASQTTSDTIEVARIPKGAIFLYGILTTTVSLGTSTVAIGITGTTGKYRTAATFTATDTPTLFGNTAAVNVANTAEETVFLTIAVATLPASGTLTITMVYAFD